MTKQEELDFKRIMIEVFKSAEGQDAIVSAVNSKGGQEAIKSGSLEAMRSKEGKEIFSENFIEVYRQLKTEVRHMKEKNDIRFERLERRTGVAT